MLEKMVIIMSKTKNFESLLLDENSQNSWLRVLVSIFLCLETPSLICSYLFWVFSSSSSHYNRSWLIIALLLTCNNQLWFCPCFKLFFSLLFSFSICTWMIHISLYPFSEWILSKRDKKPDAFPLTCWELAF